MLIGVSQGETGGLLLGPPHPQHRLESEVVALHAGTVSGTSSVASTSDSAARPVDQGVGAGDVGADLDEVLGRGRRPAGGGARCAEARCSALVRMAGSTREIESSSSMLGIVPGRREASGQTMWPSRMERAASAIGSFMSSPSTRTV
jgi:hypothetical protein